MSTLKVDTLNGSTGSTITVPSGQTLTVAGTSTTTRQTLETYSTTNSTESIFAFRISGNATVGSFTQTEDDENLGTIEWRGVGTNANAFSIGAQIRGIQSAAPHAGRVSTDIVFNTGDASDVNEIIQIARKNDIECVITNMLDSAINRMACIHLALFTTTYIRHFE